MWGVAIRSAGANQNKDEVTNFEVRRKKVGFDLKNPWGHIWGNKIESLINKIIKTISYRLFPVPSALIAAFVFLTEVGPANTNCVSDASPNLHSELPIRRWHFLVIKLFKFCLHRRILPGEFLDSNVVGFVIGEP